MALKRMMKAFELHQPENAGGSPAQSATTLPLMPSKWKFRLETVWDKAEGFERSLNAV